LPIVMAISGAWAPFAASDASAASSEIPVSRSRSDPREDGADGERRQPASQDDRRAGDYRADASASDRPASGARRQEDNRAPARPPAAGGRENSAPPPVAEPGPGAAGVRIGDAAVGGDAGNDAKAGGKGNG
jgi:hypothetical protein